MSDLTRFLDIARTRSFVMEEASESGEQETGEIHCVRSEDTEPLTQ